MTNTIWNGTEHNIKSLTVPLHPPYLPVKSESVIDTSWKYKKVILLHQDPNPAIFLVSDVKVPTSLQDEPNFLILVKMLLKEHLDL